MPKVNVSFLDWEKAARGTLAKAAVAAVEVSTERRLTMNFSFQ
jgi:hypothetical protein